MTCGTDHNDCAVGCQRTRRDLSANWALHEYLQNDQSGFARWVRREYGLRHAAVRIDQGDAPFMKTFIEVAKQVCRQFARNRTMNNFKRDYGMRFLRPFTRMQGEAATVMDAVAVEIKALDLLRPND